MRKQAVRPRGLSIDIERRLRELLSERWSAPQIAKKLQSEYPEENLPTERTIRNYLAAQANHSDTEPWTVRYGGTSDSAAILQVLGAAVLQLDGRVWYLTTDEAEWIEVITRAVPHILKVSPYVAYVLARIYISDASGEGTEHLDLSLSLVPTQAEITWLEDDGPVRSRVLKHVTIHRRHWPSRLLTVWTGSARLHKIYEEVVGGQGEMIRHSETFWVTQFDLRRRRRGP